MRFQDNDWRGRDPMIKTVGLVMIDSGSVVGVNLDVISGEVAGID
jgi:hypothetical protein